ncbi:winged helix-turn-helix domain-containing protein, partial [Victivallis vadensis]|uniref:winged helix-turn-helix domain-containing protein n=1 Tax=Victivallis vadensis TaxID=172901 RepID=UPI00266CE336
MRTPEKLIFHDMVEYLESMIVSGKYPPGSPIPTLRELCRMFRLSTGTAARGIRLMVDNNLLEVRHGSGTFVRRPENVSGPEQDAAETRIAVFMINSDPSEHYCAHALRGVQEASRHHNCRLYIRFRNHHELGRAFLDEVAAENDVLLFLGDYDTRLKYLPKTRPSVGLEMHASYDGRNSTVTLDPFSAAETAAAFFRRRKVETVRIFSHPGSIHHTRGTVFRELWNRYGGSEFIEFDPYAAPPPEACDVEDSALGYFFVSGTVANHCAVRYRERTGGCLAAERHILSLDGKSRLIHFYEPMNTIGPDWYEAGAVALEESLRRGAQPGS